MKTTRNNRRDRGMSLVEVMVASGVAALALMVVGTLAVFGLRSFVAMGNYTDLDAKSRNALDLMTRDIRQAAAVGYSTNDYSKTLWLTNTLGNLFLRYTWDADHRTFMAERSGQPESLYLGECDEWNVAFHQGNPAPNQPLVFLPATNAAGGLDLSRCKLISLAWKCSRPMPGGQGKTETVQTTHIVLRNQQP